VKRYIFLLLFLFSIPAYSDTPQDIWSQCTVYQAENYPYSNTWCVYYAPGSCGGPLYSVRLQNQSAANCSGTIQIYETATGCPGGGSFDITTHTCPAVCTSGQSGTVSVGYSKKVTGRNDIFSNADAQGNHTYCSGGCNYTYQDSGFNGTGGTSADGSVLFYNFTGTQNGTTCATPTGTTATGTNQTPTAASAVPYDNCITDSTGKKVCATASGTSQCGTVSASGSEPVEVCAHPTTPDCVNISGFAGPVCATDQKNCGWINGQYICAESDTQPAKNPDNTKDCVTNPTSQLCITGQDGVATSTATTSTSNPDGTTTTTATTSNNVVGDQPSTTTTTSGPNSSTTTNNGANQGALDGKNLGDIAKNTADTATNTAATTTALGTTNSLLQGISDFLDPAGVSGDITANDGPLDDAADADIAQLDTFHTDGSSFLSLNLFSLPSSPTCSPVSASALGKTFNFDPCTKLAPMREMLGYFFYVMLVQFAYGMATRGNRG